MTIYHYVIIKKNEVTRYLHFYINIYLQCFSNYFYLVKLTRNSYFSIIFFNCKSFQQRFYEALMSGSIPVITSTSENDAPLPFQDFIDWRLASIRIAASRIPELHFILRSITASDLLEMRRKGRFFLETYLSNTKGIIYI